MISQFVLSFLALNVILINAHGRLSVPAPRGGTMSSSVQEVPLTYESSSTALDEVGYTGGSGSTAFVCRDFQDPISPIDVEAGNDLELQWIFSAAHPGDCGIYITYDWNADAAGMRFFKIANIEQCLNFKSPDSVTIVLPDWLPPGRAVLRWEWYAVHLEPSLEFYVQCVDVQILNANYDGYPSNLKVYSAIGLLPNSFDNEDDPDTWEDESATQNYRSADAWDSYWMTGVPCAEPDSSANSCPSTAPEATQGYIDVDGLDTAVLFSSIDYSDLFATTEQPVDEYTCVGYSLQSCTESTSVATVERDGSAFCSFTCDLDGTVTAWNWKAILESDGSATGTKECLCCTNENPVLVQNVGETSGIIGVKCPVLDVTNTDLDDSQTDNSDATAFLLLVLYLTCILVF